MNPSQSKHLFSLFRHDLEVSELQEKRRREQDWKVQEEMKSLQNSLVESDLEKQRLAKECKRHNKEANKQGSKWEEKLMKAASKEAKLVGELQKLQADHVEEKDRWEAALMLLQQQLEERCQQMKTAQQVFDEEVEALERQREQSRDRVNEERAKLDKQLNGKSNDSSNFLQFCFDITYLRRFNRQGIRKRKAGVAGFGSVV